MMPRGDEVDGSVMGVYRALEGIRVGTVPSWAVGEKPSRSSIRT